MNAPVRTSTLAQSNQNARLGGIVLILLGAGVVVGMMVAKLAVYRFCYRLMGLWLIAGLLSLLIPLKFLGIRNRKVAFLVVVASSVLMAFFLRPLEKDRQTRLADEDAQAERANAEEKRKTDEAFNAMSAAAHLNAARSLLKLDAPQEKIEEGFHHLTSIPSSAPEAREARAMRQEFLRLQRERDEQTAASLLSKADKALAGQDTEQASNLLNEADKITRISPAAHARIVDLRKRITSINARKAEEAAIEANPLEVVRSTWRLGGFNTVAIWTVTFRNRSSRPVGNIKYLTQYRAETGDLVDECGEKSFGDNTIRRVISPKSARTLEINDCFVQHEAVRAGFAVTHWEFVSDSR